MAKNMDLSSLALQYRRHVIHKRVGILVDTFTVIHVKFTLYHGLINNRDTKAKCRYLKKLPCKGTLRQVFISVYRL